MITLYMGTVHYNEYIQATGYYVKGVVCISGVVKTIIVIIHC